MKKILCSTPTSWRIFNFNQQIVKNTVPNFIHSFMVEKIRIELVFIRFPKWFLTRIVRNRKKNQKFFWILFYIKLKFLKTLLWSSLFSHFENIESNGFWKWATFTYSYNITNFNVPEARRNMNGHITMSFLKTVVLSDIVKIITSYNNGALHFHFLYNTGENTSTNGNISRERTLLINVGAIASLNYLKRQYLAIQLIK